MWSGCQSSSWPRARNASRRSCVAAAVADVPLAAGDDLERAAAPLVELHRVGDRPGLAVQLARSRAAARRSRAWACLTVEPGELGVRGRGRRRWSSHVGRRGEDAAVAADDAARRQVELAPPRDVGGVAERADHGDAGALVRLGQRVGDDRHLDAEQRRAHRRAEQRLVALVVGVGDEGHAADEQLGPGRVDDARRRRAAVEGDAGGRRRAARGPRSRPGRRRCGSRRPTASAPRRCRPRRGRGCGGTPPGWRGGCGRRWSCTAASSRTTGRGGGTAPRRRPRRRPSARWHSVDEVGPRRPGPRGGPSGASPRYGGAKSGSYGWRRVAAHAVVVLHPALGGEAVVVPADREEDVACRASAGSGRWRRSGCSRTRAHVERPRHGGRRRVDREHLVARPRGAVEAVGAVGLPALGPARLDAVERRLLGDRPHQATAGRPGRTGAMRGDAAPANPPAVAQRCRCVAWPGAAPLRHRHADEVRELSHASPGTVGIYLCGPTVYGPPHLGHGRCTSCTTCCARYLRWSGLTVRLRVQRHRHRRQDHQPGQRRGPRLARDRRRGARRCGGEAMAGIGVARPTTRPTPRTTSTRWWR